MMVGEWICYKYDELGSTNDEVKRFCTEPKRKIVVQAKKQNAGRGRRGRSWVSQDGNLFFSMALEFELRYLGQLVVASSLSLAQAVRSIKNDAKVELKWPNDVLLNGAKVSGILLEKGEGNYMIVGIGVNIVDSPKGEEMIYKTISLKEAGIITQADDFLEKYLAIFTDNLVKLQNEGFESLRGDWLKLAKNLGAEIFVRQEKEQKRGIFAGIDENANLLLKNADGIEKILVGDVFYEEK